MPMYYPDLKSVQSTIETMQKHREKGKKYKGVYPKTEKDLPEARKQLGKYFREVWGDTIAAMEVEMALDHKNYHQKLGDEIRSRFFANKPL